MFSLDCMLVRSTKAPLLLVHSLSVALGVSIILLLVLAFIMHKLKKNKCSACKGKIFRIKVSKYFCVDLAWSFVSCDSQALLLI